MKRLISFCLWGDDPVYWKGAISNAHLAKKLFPGWVCRFHIASEGIPERALHQLQQFSHVEIVTHPGLGDASSMLWRFEDADDEDVAIFICRDTDSRLSVREKRAVDAWMDSGKWFHVMRDHPYHQAAMMGGMWGMRSRKNGKIREQITRWRTEFTPAPKKGVDQAFLSTRIWPEAISNACVHDPFFSGRPFPDSPRDPHGVLFVGECFAADDRPASRSDRLALEKWEKKWKHLRWLRRLRPIRF